MQNNLVNPAYNLYAYSMPEGKEPPEPPQEEGDGTPDNVTPPERLEEKRSDKELEKDLGEIGKLIEDAYPYDKDGLSPEADQRIREMLRELERKDTTPGPKQPKRPGTILPFPTSQEPTPPSPPAPDQPPPPPAEPKKPGE